ncbi:MAG: hypothetical protein K2P67_07130 [Gallionellaceae bacterium]|nr:hypothetical protein [Gallionellaceae bacterium]
MTENIKINVKADADLGGLNAALADAAKSAETLSRSMSGGVLKVDTDKFAQQINQSTALLKVLHEKIQEKKQLGIGTEDAEAQLKDLTQKKSDASKLLFSAHAGSAGITPLEQSQQRQRQEIEKTRQAFKTHFKEISTAEADALNRAKHNLDASRSPLAAYSKNHASFADLAQDKTPGAKEATQHIIKDAHLRAPGAKPKGGMASESSQYGGKLAGAAIGMAGGMVAGGAGGDGMATAGSALGGMVGSMFGPVGSMIGGALGGFAGGVVGGGLGDAKDEAIGITDLRHSLGATITDFNVLRESTRAAAAGMGITYQESVKLAKQFSHNANTQSKDAGSLAAEIRLASGFSRSLGLDPSQGVEAMSTLRNTRATTDEAGSRKMAMTIAEAITKGGMSSKGDEVLSAIANFAQSTARASLQAPNVTGYSDYMSRMVGTRTPGLDVQGSASLMGKADSSIRSHGDAGTDTFKLGAYMSAFGNEFTAADMQLYTAGGAMGTSRKTAQEILDDPNATEERKASARRVLASGNADRPNQDIMMQQLGRFRRGTSEYELSGARVFGMEQTEFRKFDKAYYANGEGGAPALQDRLNGMGINVGKLDAGKFMHMGALLGSNKDELKAEAAKLISGDGYDKALSNKEKDSLGGLMKSGSEEQLRQAIIKLNEDRSLIDDGKAVRQNTADLKNEVTKLSSMLLPKVDALRDVMLMGFGKEKEWAKHEQDVRLAGKLKEIDEQVKNEKLAGKFGKGGFYNDAKEEARREELEKAARAEDQRQQAVARQPQAGGSIIAPELVNQSLARGFELLKTGNPSDFKEGKRLIEEGKKEEAERRASQQAQTTSSSAPLKKTQQQMMASLSSAFRNDFSPLLEKWNSANPNRQIELESGARTKEEQDAIRADYKRRGVNIPVADNSDHFAGNAADVRSKNGRREDVIAFNRFAVSEGFTGNIPNDPMHIGARRNAGAGNGASGNSVVEHRITLFDSKGKQVAEPFSFVVEPATPAGFKVATGRSQ